MADLPRTIKNNTNKDIYMKKHMYYSITLSILTLFTACEKIIEVKVNDAVGKLVIEGKINNQDSLQEIRLSRNIPLTATGTSTPVSKALVVVRDDAQHEYLFRERDNGIYTALGFIGSPNSNYTMEVRVDEQVYTAVSKMPEIVLLDSIAVEKTSFGNKERRKVKVFYKDPADQKNSYRFIAFVNNKQTGDMFVANDDFNNGNKVNLSIILDEDVDIKMGDILSIEMQCIDNNLHNYWYTLMRQSNGGNITPSNPPSNIKPNTLGYFSAYTTSSKSLIVD
jgi:hypothetical protein